jgi:TolB-like protein
MANRSKVLRARRSIRVTITTSPGVRALSRVVTAVGSARKPTSPGPDLPDKPSIAVLPFANMSGDPKQEYFADGMVEKIITALSRIRWLFVTARNSSFSYKGQSPDVKRVGRELGVRYASKARCAKRAIACASPRS